MGDRHSSRSKRPRCPVNNPVDHHTGSPNKGPAATFLNVSAAHKKVAQVAKLLKDERLALEFQSTDKIAADGQ